jgi:hypothetical protein
MTSHAEYMRKWRTENPERWREIAHKARAKWKLNNRSAHREAQRNHRYTVRREILDLLGGQRCVQCGYDKDWRALQIDHIHSDGRNDRNTPTGTGVWAFRKKLMDPTQLEFARTRYQVLCANCNVVKKYEKNEFGGRMAKVSPDKLRRRRTRKQREEIPTIESGFS